MKKLLFVSILFIYSLNALSQTFTDSNLPIVIINTEPNEIVDAQKVIGTMKIIYRPDGSRNFMTDQNTKEFLNYDGKLAIEFRGSSSQVLPKKPYGLTTLNADNTTNSVSILGMPKESDWILNSLAFDESLIRNYFSYYLARSIGDYAARGVYCEVVINGDYKGLYIFMEKIKIDGDRINILKMTKTDISNPNVTGGYVIKADKLTGGDPVAWTMDSYNGGTLNYSFENPKPADVMPQQSTYIKSQFTALQTAMTSKNNSIVDGFPSIIDVPSFVDFMIINEFASNADAYQYSTFFHKERNGKLRAGPVWDFDLTYGNDLFFWGLNRSFTYVWQFDNKDNTGSKFWKDLYDNSIFNCYLTKRWKELNATNGPLSYDVVSANIDQIVSLISEAKVRENARWGTIKDHSANISAMKGWIKDRIIWLNSRLTSSQSCSNPSLPTLVISKINYNPKEANGLISDDQEFIEITNNGTTDANLTGVYFTQLGLTYQFPANAVLGPNEKVVIASSSSTFLKIYGKGPLGEYTRHLSNKSQKIVLADAFGNVIDSVRYQDLAPWPVEADGGGYFLELNDLNSDNSVGSNWKISSNLVLGIKKKSIDNFINFYPNPATSNVSVESQGKNIELYEIFDINGRKILSNNVTGANFFTINVTSLLPGNYILKLKCQNGEVMVQKINKIP